MARPSKLPRWAVLDVVDPISGQNNVSDPDSSDPTKKAQGWSFKEFPPRQWFNFLSRLTYQWIEYIDVDLFGNVEEGAENRVLTIAQIDAWSADLAIQALAGDLDIDAGGDMFLNAGTLDAFVTGNITLDTGGSGGFFFGTGAASDPFEIYTSWGRFDADNELILTASSRLQLISAVEIGLFGPVVATGNVLMTNNLNLTGTLQDENGEKGTTTTPRVLHSSATGIEWAHTGVCRVTHSGPIPVLSSGTDDLIPISPPETLIEDGNLYWTAIDYKIQPYFQSSRPIFWYASGFLDSTIAGFIRLHISSYISTQTGAVWYEDYVTVGNRVQFNINHISLPNINPTLQQFNFYMANAPVGATVNFYEVSFGAFQL